MMSLMGCGPMFNEGCGVERAGNGVQLIDGSESRLFSDVEYNYQRMQAEIGGGAKEFVQKMGKAFCEQEEEEMTELFRELYQEGLWDRDAKSWQAQGSLSGFRGEATLASCFTKMMELIKKYQSIKLKSGIVAGFKVHMEVIIAALKVFESVDQESVWVCKPVRQVVRATKKIFLRASKEAQEVSTDVAAVKKEDLVNALQRFKTSRNLGEEVKGEILPLVDNMQVSIMLFYHNYEPIKRILESNKSYGEHGPHFEDNYYFQRGKAALINERMTEAELYLEKVNVSTRGQKRLVLKYLIPCKMFLGKMFEGRPDQPDEHFPEYQPIISSLINANFEEYDTAIRKYQKLWIKRGIYLVMDQLRVVIWRNLIRRVSQVIGDKISFEDIQKAVKVSSGVEEPAEVVCIVSNLIHDGYVKGYIFQAEERKVLVLKKGGQAFPPLSKIYQ